MEEHNMKHINEKQAKNIVLKDDATPTGGTSFAGETLADFIEELSNVSPFDKYVDWYEDGNARYEIPIKLINKALVECGIEPIKRFFKFVPAYYEWHLVDADTNEVLFAMDDPSDSMWIDEDTPITPEELQYICRTALEEDEKVNDTLTAEEIKTAAKVMFDSLYNYYIA